jgi:hypothetical protein
LKDYEIFHYYSLFMTYSPNGLALSRVDRLLPKGILHSNKETHLYNFSPRLATSAAAPGWALFYL